MALVIPFPASLVGHKNQFPFWESGNVTALPESWSHGSWTRSLEQTLLAQLSTKDDHQTICTWQLLRKLRDHSMVDFEEKICLSEDLKLCFRTVWD